MNKQMSKIFLYLKYVTIMTSHESIAEIRKRSIDEKFLFERVHCDQVKRKLSELKVNKV